MKKYSFILLAAFAVCLISCNKEKATIEDPEQKQEVEEIVEPVQEVEKLVFGVSIDLGENVAPASTKASLSGLNINWAGGETIFIANDVNDDIEDCVLTKDPTYDTKGTIAVTPVAGATTYFALYTGGTDHSEGKVAFNHSTSVFSGKEVTLSHSVFYENTPSGAPVSMAGKTTGDNLTLKPCLSLIKLKVADKSVAAQYEGGYSGVRGILLIIRKSGSRKLLWGDYAVDLSGSNLAVSNGTTTKDYFELNNGLDLMDDEITYYIPMLPLGAADKVELTFYGFNSATPGDYNFGSYNMALETSFSIDPGDILNFGTLDPVSLKKKADEFVPAITMDGSFTGWDSIDMYPGDDGKDAFPGDGTYIYEWKATSDSKYIYFYYKISETQVYTWGQYEACLATGFDLDNNSGTGDSFTYNLGAGFEAGTKANPFKNGANADVICRNLSNIHSESYIKCPVSSSSLGTVATCGSLDGAGNVFVETRIPREKIGSPSKDSEIRVRHAFGWKAVSDAQVITLAN